MRGGPEKRHVLINGLRLHYLEWNKEGGSTMILLHGTGDNAHIWDHFASSVPNHFRIIALDQRGHGESDWPRPPAYGCEDYVNDLDKLIQSLHLEKVIIMGHSMGALHATRYAATRVRTVVGLIHVDIEPRPPSWNKKYLHGLYETLPDSYSSVKEFADQLRETSPYAKKEMLNYLAALALNKGSNGRFYRTFDKEVLSHFDRYDLRNDLSSVICPTLIIRGKESRVMGRKAALEMSLAVSKSRLVEIPRATHPVHTDNPIEFQRVVLEFLKEFSPE